MICGVFGLPRAGKTTFLTYLALRALKGKALSVGHARWKKKIGEFAPYDRVFCNFPIEGCFKLDFDALGVYDFSNSLILIDEIMLVCDSRDWKNFRQDLRDFLALHGHYRCDLVYCSQGYKDTDLRIRNLTERIFYIEKFGSYTRIRPIDKGFQIDDQIKEGYTLGSPLAATYLRRSKYYRFFDSFDAPPMPENPAAFWDAQAAPKVPFYIPFCRSVKKYFTRGEPLPPETVKVLENIEHDFPSSGAQPAAPASDSLTDDSSAHNDSESQQILDFFAMSNGN